MSEMILDRLSVPSRHKRNFEALNLFAAPITMRLRGSFAFVRFIALERLGQTAKTDDPRGVASGAGPGWRGLHPDSAGAGQGRGVG